MSFQVSIHSQGFKTYISACLRQLQAKSKTRAMKGRCKFIKCVVGRKFLQKTVCWNIKKMFLFISLPWLSNELLWSINKLEQGL